MNQSPQTHPRPWPTDPRTAPLNPSRRVKGSPYSPPPTFGHRQLIPQPWRGLAQLAILLLSLFITYALARWVINGLARL